MKPRNPIARALAKPEWHQRVVKPDIGKGRKTRPRRPSLRAEELRLLEVEEEYFNQLATRTKEWESGE